MKISYLDSVVTLVSERSLVLIFDVELFDNSKVVPSFKRHSLCPNDNISTLMFASLGGYVERELLRKIARVMTQRYDCPVRFVVVDDENNPHPSDEDRDIIDVVVRNRASEIVISRYGVLMPIKDMGALSTIAIFQTSENWLPTRMEQVRFQLDMVMNGIQQLPPMKAVQAAENVLDEELPTHMSPILIEAMPTAPTREFALELHDLAERQFFLALSDLDPNTLRSKQDFRDLGAMTLFIPDISKVSMRMQKLIGELIEAEGDKLEIKFIAVCHADIHSMVQVGLIDSLFAEYIQGGFLKWPPKLESSGSIHEVLEKLLSRPETRGKPRLQIIRSSLH